MISSPIEVRPVQADDRARWCVLFDSYREASGLPADALVNERVWGWLMDPAHPVSGLVVDDGADVPGLAHHRPFPRPVLGDEGIHLDDLFTDPRARGRGVARALIEHLAAGVRDGSTAVLRWTTRPGNTAARALYDQVAEPADSVVYNLT